MCRDSPKALQCTFGNPCFRVALSNSSFFRAHRNDMENIYPFLFLGAVYSLLDPNPAVARIHFLVFFLSRVVHTVAYLLKLKAPTRSVAYSLAQLPCFSMALQILCALIKHW